MKKLFMLVGMMILLIVITSASGCTLQPRYSFAEGVFHYRYNPSLHESLNYCELVSVDDELFIDEMQIEVKNISKEEYDASNFKNVIKHHKKEEYHSIIFKLKYSKEAELTQYDMYDMREKINWVGDYPDSYPIKICLANNKYNIEGEVYFNLTTSEYNLSLDYHSDTPEYVDKPLTLNGTIRKLRTKRDYVCWYLEKDEPLTYSRLNLNYFKYGYIYTEEKDDCLHKLTEDLIVDEIYLYLDDITNQEYLESNFVNVIDIDPHNENSTKKKITFKLKFTCEEEAKEYDVIFLPEDKHYHNNSYTLLVKLINEELNLNVDLKFELSDLDYVTLTYKDPTREYVINDTTYYDYGYNLSFILEEIVEQQ